MDGMTFIWQMWK